jgi:hypothetical protein
MDSKVPAITPTSSLPETDRVKTFKLYIRQQPKMARCSTMSEKTGKQPYLIIERKPLDPPTIGKDSTDFIVQFFIDDPTQSKSKQYLYSVDRSFLHNPFYFLYASLWDVEFDKEVKTESHSRIMTGSYVSSFYRLRDLDDTFAGFFVFPDIIFQKEGRYRLKMSLYEMVG